MITEELLKGNSALADLTPEQVEAITTLSKNDENAVIAQKIGELHGRYDEDFEKALGVKKPQGVKSYEFWPSQIKELKEVAAKAGDTSKIDELQATISDLEAKIKEGAGKDALVQKLEKEKAALAATVEQTKKQVGDIEADYQKKFEAAQTEYQTHLKEFEQMQIRQYFEGQVAGLKFKDTIPGQLQKLAVNNAMQKVLNEYEAVKVEKEDGSFAYQFKKDGVVANNPKNGLNPYTGLELMKSHLEEIIDTGKVQPGGGTKPNPKPGGSISDNIVDVTGAKTRNEAMDMIKQGLAAQGISVTDPRYNEIKNNTWEQVVKPMNLPQR